MVREKENVRYIVGIDLGTTNSTLSYVDVALLDRNESIKIEDFRFPQLGAPGRIEESELLPSFLYLPIPGEFEPSQLVLPWTNSLKIIGQYAREHGAKSPGRVISSAKSWLGKCGTNAVLPPGAPPDLEKMTPVAVQAAFLAYMREAWNYHFRETGLKLQDQEIYLAVPASFNPAARELTRKAAEEAGLGEVTLVEEPQAAFYSWINAFDSSWRKEIKKGDLVLVVDIGGGTTDLTLVSVEEKEGELVLERIAVGDHLLLGGDNMDIAVANLVRGKLEGAGKKIDHYQFMSLWHEARRAKEILLSEKAPEKVKVTVLGKGRGVIGGVLSEEVTRDEIEKLILDGFFPYVPVDSSPHRSGKTGLVEIGLAYEQDPGVTRHLASFLRAAGQRMAGGLASPTAILFNGGVMCSALVRRRLIEVIESWTGRRVKELSSFRPEMAVSRGAAVIGLARRGKSIRIRGGTTRSYWVGLEASMPSVPGMKTPLRALLVVPAGTEEGTVISIENREFGVVVGEKVHFNFFMSKGGKGEKPGTVLDDYYDTLEELPPLEAVLDMEAAEPGSIVPVRLESRVTEVGTIELWAAGENKKWKLEFSFREIEE